MSFIAPGSAEHTRMVTASKVAPILALSPWVSQREVWHTMRGDIVKPFEQRDVFDDGHDMEDSIANMWRRRNPGWRLGRSERQYSRDDLPFPNAATLDRVASRGRWRKSVELKTSQSDEHWGEAGTDEVPDAYGIQVQFQMGISGIHETDVMVFFSLRDKRIYTIRFDPDLFMAIVQRCDEFYKSLSADVPPELDDSLSCEATLKKLHADIEPFDVEVGEELGIEYVESLAGTKAAEARERKAKSRMYDAMGTARFAKSNGVTIGRRQPSGKGVSLYAVKATPEQIRDCRQQEAS